MKDAKGLKKGLVQQWQNTSNAMDKFAFLKAFLLDRDMGSIQVEAYYEEMSENSEKEKFVELPLCQIIEKYAHLPGGEQFVKDIQASQVGKRHPQSADPNWRIYKIFKEIEASRCLAAHSGSMTSIMLYCHSCIYPA
ncbi:NaCP60E [Symbiodinium sp. CCMP2592]|nr:NaCP60E [Symbiodinium sp. CCMP2592]CAE7267814.1 NaCP60E [Symbiodinium sp. CCMP2592]